jgi:hypothetical protein
MSISSTHRRKPEESSENQERADAASDAFVVGVDTEGREHVFSRIRNAVTVLDADGTHEHTQSLSDRSLKSWMAFIEQEHGDWRENNTFTGSVADDSAGDSVCDIPQRDVSSPFKMAQPSNEYRAGGDITGNEQCQPAGAHTVSAIAQVLS